MGRFEKLVKGKDVTIGDETFNITPLKMKHYGLFQKYAEVAKENTDVSNMTQNQLDKQIEFMIDIIYESLKQADETIEKKDLDDIGFKTLTQVMEVIMDVNELNES